MHYTCCTSWYIYYTFILYTVSGVNLKITCEYNRWMFISVYEEFITYIWVTYTCIMNVWPWILNDYTTKSEISLEISHLHMMDANANFLIISLFFFIRSFILTSHCWTFDFRTHQTQLSKQIFWLLKFQLPSTSYIQLETSVLCDFNSFSCKFQALYLTAVKFSKYCYK